jgi:membrane glycosyltransferase
MSRRTPAGLQSVAELAWRRRVVAALNLALYAGLLFWLGSLLSHGGWSAIDVAILAAFAIAAPWSVLGASNAALGFWLLHLRRDGVREAAPFLAAGEDDAPLTKRIAVLMTIRNEDAARALARLRAVKESVDHTGEGALFDWFVLSDTNDPGIAAQEEAAFAAWRAEAGMEADRLHYRRRAENRGYKAGNIRDFCERFGAGFEFMVPLDADSLMDGQTILFMARICEAYPRLGILQSLVVGAPSRSAFARMFQFGMRHGMRSYTIGAAWWGGDCGPFWGHNAFVRVAPFLEHCGLPSLKNGRDILSHDQIEAALMRRAGFEVRALPIETGSFEENPPTLVDFVKRDLRWCRGNMQYIGLWRLPDLLPMSRFQLFWAVSMFIGAPAATALVLLAPVAAAVAASDFPSGSLKIFYVMFLALQLAPKLAGFADVAVTRGGLRRYGGAPRFFLGAAVELLGSFVIGAATTFNVSLFLVALPFGRSFDWSGQLRDAHGLSLREAASAFWPHTLFGAALYGVGFAVAPDLLTWSLPVSFGYLAAIPFAVTTASTRVGAYFARMGLFSTPEELAACNERNILLRREEPRAEFARRRKKSLLNSY